MISKLLLTAAVVALAAPAGVAFAHEDPYEYGYYQQHREDHSEHRDFHRQAAEEHEALHEQGGFYDVYDHAAYHQALAREHREVHRQLPNTWHDHYRGYGYGQSYYGYPSGYGYGYTYSPYSSYQGW